MSAGTVVAALCTRSTTQQRIAGLVAGLTTAAVVMLSCVVLGLPRLDAPLDPPWLVWAAAFAVGESLVVHVQVRRDAHTFSLTDLVLAAALCLAQPAALVTAQVAGTGLALVLVRRQRGLKLAFNLAEFGLCAGVATTVFAAVTRGAPWSSPWAWVAALLAVGAAIVTGNLCVFAAIRLADGGASGREVLRLLAPSLPFALGTGAVGLLVVRTAVLDPVALALLGPPVALMVAAYRAYTHARRQQDNLRLLHRATSLLYDSENAQDGLGNFVSAVRGAFRSGVAELVLLGGDDGTATVTRSREGQETVALLPVESADDVAGLLRWATAGAPLTTRSGLAPHGPLDEYVERRGLKDAVMSVLRTDERVHGILMVAGRLGDVSTFTASDLTLLETFARHVATSLERGRLQSDLRHVIDLQEKLRHQAMHDALTGLPNRTLFLDRAEHALRLAERTHQWPAVLYLDLDGFKPVNDTYGHEAGDLVLQAFAQRLAGCLRSADTAARLGGDEFAVLVHGPIDSEGVNRVVRRIRAELGHPIALGAGREATVGASIGVTIADAGTSDVETLLRRADAAMYTAKRARAGGYVLHEESRDPSRV
jgi:diguanylate cyclase (GGDEF)-like protein